jgi:hypothetical protein
VGSLCNDFKEQLADLIKQGSMLCGGISEVVVEAGAQIADAAFLYKKLRGKSYL